MNENVTPEKPNSQKKNSEDLIDLVKLPEGKIPKSIADENDRASFFASVVADSLPKSEFRLSVLKDRDVQLNKLLDFFASLCIPMGADDWAVRAILRIKKLEADSKACATFLRSLENDRVLKLEELKSEISHARRMYSKDLPKMEIHCDWCGYSPARGIGDGHAACYDCLPKSVEDSGVR